MEITIEVDEDSRTHERVLTYAADTDQTVTEVYEELLERGANCYCRNRDTPFGPEEDE